MSIYWINVIAAIHDLIQWPLFVSFLTSVILAITYVALVTDKECDLRVCKIIAKVLAFSVSILLVSSIVYVMSSPIE